MKLVKKFEIQNRQNISNFLNNQPVGRISTIDANNFPQIIPMNFVYTPNPVTLPAEDKQSHDVIYMHSHPFGEKIENIKRNSKSGFEVDKYICFLPSYYFHPIDASQADTLYISVVMKGNSYLVNDFEEKAFALNALMKKYQKEGKYKLLESPMKSVQEVTVIKFIPFQIHGKYKIGQHWERSYRLKMAEQILNRENLSYAKSILSIMGIRILDNGTLEIVQDPNL
ncbi:MAG: flavin-nucleotide-binding protein [Nitrososphaeraceae archaeon]|nr:flavin-nucleotide-binding protein [Nitrososphaeraceae archaeon]